MAERLSGFAPVIDRRAEVLILGSFPGEASLRAGHYYAHPRNQFWPILSTVLGEPLEALPFERRYRRVRARRIAIWDVLAACERRGSLDADIRRPAANPFDELPRLAPRLRAVLFNGRTAARFEPMLRARGYRTHVLPSTSPAHAGRGFAQKLCAWRTALAEAGVAEALRGGCAPPTPITLSEERGIRYLHFGSPWVQGAMRIDAPDVPVLDYVQQMMAWLLFLRPPQRVLQLGLGAGALTRFCLRHCPKTRVTAVELSEEVIDTARQWFALPRNGPRLEVVCDDAQRFLAAGAPAAGFGVIQVDLYDMHARGPTIESPAFYASCARALAAPGLCVVNLFGDHPAYRRNLRRLSEAFDGRILELPATAAGNRVVLAFRGPPLSVGWPALLGRAEVLRKATGLPATRWVRGLRRSLGGGTLAL